MGPRHLIPALALLVAPAIAPVAAHAQGEPALWRFADPNSKSVIGIDWARIRSSAAGAEIRKSLPPEGALPGFLLLKLLDSVDRVLISSPAAPAAAASSADPANGDSENLPVLIAIQGRFDAAQMRQLFTFSGAKAQSYNSFQVYRPQAKTNGKMNKDSAWVLYDAHTVLFGDAPLVFAALDRNEFGPPAGPAARPGSLAARAGELDAKYQIWGILDVAEVASNDALAGFLHGGEWVSEVQGMEGGLNLGAGLDADFILHLASEDAAKHVIADLQSALTATAKDNSAGAQAQALVKKLKFSADGGAAKISLHMNQQELEQATQTLKAGLNAGQRAAAGTPGAQPVLTPAAPAKPGVIRIEGLDEGPREIPYQQQPQQ
jgi:hypothetical protein